MANFKTAYEIGRVNEGGYVNDKDDLGGETYSGVARNYWPNWKGWKIIDVIKKNRTIRKGEHIKNVELEGLLFNFYEDNFWKKIKGNDIKNQSIANLFYDWSLTSGGAIKEVQKAFGLTSDGIIGAKSIAKINEANPVVAFETIKTARKVYYQKLVQQRPTNAKFLKGWLNRVASFEFKA